MGVFFLMLLCHIIDDFVLQGTCLVNLKQKKWWEQNAPQELYKYDYLIGLAIHCLSWSIMIHLPIILLFITNGWILTFSILINAVIHFIVDDLKANKFKINLITDQTIHIIQVILTFLLFFAIL